MTWLSIVSPSVDELVSTEFILKGKFQRSEYKEDYLIAVVYDNDRNLLHRQIIELVQDSDMDESIDVEFREVIKFDPSVASDSVREVSLSLWSQTESSQPLKTIQLRLSPDTETLSKPHAFSGSHWLMIGSDKFMSEDNNYSLESPEGFELIFGKDNTVVIVTDCGRFTDHTVRVFHMPYDENPFVGMEEIASEFLFGGLVFNPVGEPTASRCAGEELTRQYRNSLQLVDMYGLLYRDDFDPILLLSVPEGPTMIFELIAFNAPV